MRMQSFTLFAIGTLLTIMLPACTSEPSPAQPENPLVMQSRLVGNWHSEDGSGTLAIYENNRFLWQPAFDNSQTTETLRGSVTATKSQMRFIFDPDMPMCVDTLGIYDYTLDNGALQLFVVHDTCASRQAWLDPGFTLEADTSLPPASEDRDPTEPEPGDTVQEVIVSEDIPDPDPLEPPDAPGHDD